MTIEYNLVKLYNIYNQSLNEDEPTLVFEIRQGRGIFTFLMFFSEEDIESKDKLFIYLRNTNVFITVKLYGNHKKGDFKIYLSESNQEKIIEELQLEKNKGNFNFIVFFTELSKLIPQQLNLQEKINKLREIWGKVKSELKDTIDQADKTILIGIKHLPNNQKPQYKTLRKLYTYTNSDAQTIHRLINILIHRNITLCWINDPLKKNIGLSEVFSQIRVNKLEYKNA